MAQQLIGIGSAPNDGTGDTLRAAFDKVNDNFTEVYAATADVAGDTHAATEKTTPVDADEVPLVDSAALFVLKRLTWANIKTTLSGVFALLAGKAGGQTLIGGTGVTDKLVLQGTSGNGTTTSSALEIKVGNNGATNALVVLNNGDVGIGTESPGYALHLNKETPGVSSGFRVTSNYSGGVADSYLGNFGQNYGLLLSNERNPATGVFTGSAVAPNQTRAVALSLGGVANTYMFAVANYPSGTLSNKLTLDKSGNLNIPLGTLGVGTVSSSAKLHVVGTTEQLRLGYDASNYASFTVDAAGNLTLTNTGTTPSVYIATLRSGFKVTAVTTTASPAATDAGTAFTNEGDADGATITLPTAAAGLNFIAYVQTAQTLTITAASGDTIRIASSVTAAAGSITSAVVGSSVTLVAINATEWVATASIGSWSF